VNAGGEERERNNGWPFLLGHAEQPGTSNCRNANLFATGDVILLLGVQSGQGNNPVVNKVCVYVTSSNGTASGDPFRHAQRLKTKNKHAELELVYGPEALALPMAKQ
jgi:hypothetical protein